ncbi:MAG: PfkB family carbohydrate kinase, partial [Desulfurococcaceae archaeon]
SYVKRIRGRSGLVVSLVLPGGRRTLLSYRGVCAENIVEINEIDDVLENAELVYGSGYVFNNVDNGSSLVEIFSRAQDYDAQTFLELGGIEKTSARNLFALRNLVDYVSLNVHELYSLTGTGDLAIAVEKLYTLLEPRAMFIKAGEKGSFVYNGKDLIEIPSCRVSSVDPTGCGDAFNAGVIYGVLRKLDLSKAALIGNIMGAYKVLGLGARHLPRSFDDLKEFAESNCKIKLDL